MRILLVNDYGTIHGGAEVIVFALRDALRARGHEVRVFTSSAGGSDLTLQADDRCFGTIGRWRTLVQCANPAAALALRRVLGAFRPDVVHVNLYLTQLSPLILRTLRGTPSIYYAQWCRAICPTGTRRLPDGSTCRHRIGMPCLRNGCLSAHDFPLLMAQSSLERAWGGAFGRVTAISRTVAERLREFGGPHLRSAEVVYPGTEVVEPRATASDAPTAISAGRLVAEKGIDVLLRAFARARARTPRARLVLVGSGPERAALERLAEELGIRAHVDFRGHLRHKDAMAAVREAWVACVPSLWEEPFGMIAAEAQMLGVAVAASRTGGLAEIVEDGATGWLVPPGDVEALAGSLDEAFAGRGRTLERGAAGHAMARARFGAAGCAERFESVYRQVADGRSAVA